jgi:hypothetical protein
MKAVVWSLAFGLVAPALLHAQTPPLGPTWKRTAAEGKSEASSKGIPILIFVAGGDANSQTMGKSFEDPGVVRLTRHFACVFLGKDYDRTNFQQSYVPWIGSTPQTTHSPPCLIFGDSQGNPRADLRIEGKGLSPADLTKHLQKALDALAPSQSFKAKLEALEAAKLGGILKTLGESLAALDAKLSESTVEEFKEELAWASLVARYVEPKLKEIKVREARAEAAKALKDLKKALSDLGRFRGKEVDKFRSTLSSAGQLLEQLSQA